MAQIVTVFTPKGGAGKTTIALHLGYALSRPPFQKRVALVDADERKMLFDHISRSPESFADLSVFRFESTGGNSDEDAEQILEVIDEASHDRDVVIVDCGGYAAMSAVYSAAASNLVLIPLTPSMFDVQQAFDAYQQLAGFVAERGPALAIRAVINQADLRTNAFSVVKSTLAEGGVSCLETPVPASTVIRDASFAGATVYTYRPGHQIIVSLNRLARECAKLLEQTQGATP